MNLLEQFSVIPIPRIEKRPKIRWEVYRHRKPTEKHEREPLDIWHAQLQMGKLADKIGREEKIARW